VLAALCSKNTGDIRYKRMPFTPATSISDAANDAERLALLLNNYCQAVLASEMPTAASSD
jgi:hypothetical protein